MAHRLFILATLLGAFLPNLLQAQFSPGPLSQPHAHLSGITNCLNCHTLGNKDQSPNCLECHTPIQARINAGSGFHGQLDDQNCLTCHSEHVSRDFQLIHWVPSQDDFDHGQTDFKLDGRHLEQKCRDCHTRDLIKSEDILNYAQASPDADILSKTFLGLHTDCAKCHADVHQDEFVDQVCKDCHTTEDWIKARKSFDHSKKTEFPLKGAHKTTDCEKCHEEKQPVLGDYKVPRFTGLKFDLCTACHKDEHQDAFGQDCLECHTVDSFKKTNNSALFDHDQTRFTLVGEHRNVNCTKCHTEKDQYKLTETFDACYDCHTDYHDGAFMKSDRNLSCDQCHSTSGFFPSLFGVKEHADTRFPLEGSHLAQPCIFCHKKENNRKAIYHWESIACKSCHDTIHGEQFSKYLDTGDGCKECHQTTDWTLLLFDHKQTNFLLTDRHAEISCASCHKVVSEIIQYESVDTQCAGCHDDVHVGQFQDNNCDGCHAPSSWNITLFDHLNLTQFPLDGQHENLACGQCHKYESDIHSIRFKPISHKCQDCHSFGELK